MRLTRWYRTCSTVRRSVRTAVHSACFQPILARKVEAIWTSNSEQDSKNLTKQIGLNRFWKLATKAGLVNVLNDAVQRKV